VNNILAKKSYKSEDLQGVPGLLIQEKEVI